jgi:hypothetical protein
MDFPDAAGRQRVADAVRHRRTVDRHLRQEDVTAAGGPSKGTLNQIESGMDKAYTPAVLARLEDVLKWGHGSIKNIYEGGEPIPLDQPPAAPDPPSDSPDAITVSRDGWTVVIHPKPGASAEEIAQGQDALILAIMAEVRRLKQGGVE